MDAELIAYLDGRFRESAQQIQSFREEVLGRFERIEARLDQAEARFERIEARLHQIDDRLDKAEETARHTLILVESLRHQLQLVAEGVSGLTTRLERLERKGILSFETFRVWMEPFFNNVEARSREVDARSIQLNVPVKDLDNRVGTLEGWVARHGEEASDALANLIAKSRPIPSE